MTIKTTITLTEDDLRHAILAYTGKENPVFSRNAGRITFRRGFTEMTIEESRSQMDSPIVCEVEVNRDD